MDFGFIVAIFFILSIIVGWIIAVPVGIAYFLAFIICIEKKECKKDVCCLRGFCNKTALSAKEKALIKKKIESLGDKEQDE